MYVQAIGLNSFLVIKKKNNIFLAFQTISLLLYLTKKIKNKERFLILCPLSILSNWKEELER